MTAAVRDADANGTEDMILLFTDTLIEDKDLYRFMIESAGYLFGLPKPLHLISRCDGIPDVNTDMLARRAYLSELAADTTGYIPALRWISDGRDPWEVFWDRRWIGNSRIAQCSEELKQKISRQWVKERHKPDETVIYVGIDWTETHRVAGIERGWSPYRVIAPMTERPYLYKTDMLNDLKRYGIKAPRLYDMGFAHNNCGGFCVRGGQGHFINLLKNNRDLYLYHESKELEMQEYLGRTDVTILTRTVKGVEHTLTLRELREEWDNGLGLQVDLLDIGGCGCYV
ncbi:hypothetical protein [Paenibacillus maysiensis]|uniref:hypothetical protein n=1 Tax=Paenibacillus maysiensis TaxID=1155954 RepID=UPI0004713EAE|nr:hypothetical protein [Paenibacillus maysiensis]